MIFINVLNALKTTDGSFKNMKFPWEQVVDIFIILITMSSTFVYMGYFLEGNRVWCVTSYGDTQILETYDMLFIASICKLHFKIALLIYFPYISFALVCLITVSHFFWKEIPWIQRKMNLFALLCLQVTKLKQEFYSKEENKKKEYLKKFDFSEEQNLLIKVKRVMKNIK